MEKKRIYVKPQMEELKDAVSMILAASGLGVDEEMIGSRQEYSDFTEDDLDSEE